MKPQAIQTFYKGYHFRSRLEARWAVFFDALGLKWEYEPEGFELPGGVRYLPDFFVYSRSKHLRHGSGYWVEIKGLMPEDGDDELVNLHSVCKSTEHNGYLFHGLPDNGDPYWFCHRNASSAVIRPDQRYGEHGPMDTIEQPFKTWHSMYFSVEFPWLGCLDVDIAAKRARSARFEFGQSGSTV